MTALQRFESEFVRTSRKACAMVRGYGTNQSFVLERKIEDKRLLTILSFRCDNIDKSNPSWCVGIYIVRNGGVQRSAGSNYTFCTSCEYLQCREQNDIEIRYCIHLEKSNRFLKSKIIIF